MRRPTLSGIFLIAAGVFILLPRFLGETMTIAAGLCLIVAGALSSQR